MPLYNRKEHQVLFVHIPKCAGSTVEDLLLSLAEGCQLFSRTAPTDLPCGAQHFHAAMLRQVLPNIESVPCFSIVRHPLFRAISEHQYRNKLRRRKNEKETDLDSDVASWFHEYRFNNYIFDNHIRPQIEFILPNTCVFHLEHGLDGAIQFAGKTLDLDNVDIGESSAQKKNASQYFDFALHQSTVDKIQHFYRYDFRLFRYEEVKLARNESVTYSELLKSTPKSPNIPFVYDDELIRSYFTNKGAYDKTKQLQKLESIARWLTKRYFKLSSRQ